ncbi:MAG: hypothetical protein ACRENB_08550 [Gemmatimonadales bacterium]
MIPRWTLLLFTVCAPVLEAQGPFRPRVIVTIGPHAISTTYADQGPGTISSDGQNLLGGVGVGLGVSRRVNVEAEYRRAVGGNWTFQAINLGFSVRAGGPVGSYVRFAFARLSGREPGACDAAACLGAGGEGRVGLEAALGMDFGLGTHTAVGPRFTWAQSLGAMPKYRLIGLGLVVSAF